ncbi:NAD+---dinitrogen-reductase ADP-D-ribosyltransferase [Marinospirillum alkaliphilum DSM 21637]|uniref:NAD+---dinitrogen-reductase ADP-D-ribosyltransferase n=1 Tax=Marinospirillum alkaliphilum DSM 21637 TaxID=1122209 RepID=A0A1K1TXX4_9GAMM|nr:NAD+---dinitrogen-reductase ADP-D-ribosyltransferase [Marinospirillum alkaliphilum DSM 21637]
MITERATPILIHRNSLSSVPSALELAIATSGEATLPVWARRSFNRCNLPPVILGSLTFQQQPVPLLIDGVHDLHRRFFMALDELVDPALRALHFRQYMCSAFLLNQVDLAGADPARQRLKRHKADYLRLLRGWLFNADGMEAAVLKHWVESRFGLLPRNHRSSLKDFNSACYAAYQAEVSRGLYNANALEAQLDLLYSFCQYELARRFPGQQHWLLYRGVNRIEAHELLGSSESDCCRLVLNNLNSFSSDRDMAGAFGDAILETRVPGPKLLYFPGLLPDVLQGEQEHLVIGGVYQVQLGR